MFRRWLSDVRLTTFGRYDAGGYRVDVSLMYPCVARGKPVVELAMRVAAQYTPGGGVRAFHLTPADGCAQPERDHCGQI